MNNVHLCPRKAMITSLSLSRDTHILVQSTRATACRLCVYRGRAFGPPPFAVLWRPLGLLSLRVRRSDKNPPASGLGNARARAHSQPPPAIAWAAPQQARQNLLSACEDAAHGPYTSQLNKAWWRSGVQQTAEGGSEAGSRACQFASRQNLRMV